MARWRRVALWSVLGLIVLLAVAITATVGWRPFIGPAARPLTDRTFERTAERLERGRYMFTSMSGCIMCHSEWDQTDEAHPPKPGMEGAGRVWTDEGLPWLTAPNLTPDKETGAGDWTDDMFARAIREGIGHDGRALFPVMPYEQFNQMSDEDLASVVVYLRSLKPVRNPLPKTAIPFPPGPLINAVPQPITTPVSAPDNSNPLRRGQYLVRMAVCTDCHTPSDDKGNRLPGMEFGGGFLLQNGQDTITSANITQDPSGIPYYDEALFLSTIRTGKVVTRPLHYMMPWRMYRNLTDDDLKMMYGYLKTVTPVMHRVDNSLPPTPCPVCKGTHGAGDKNPAPVH